MFCCVVKVCTFVFSKHTHSWGGGGGSINTSEASQERVKETGLYFVILLLYFVNRTCLSSISSVHFRLVVVGVDMCLGQ